MNFKVGDEVIVVNLNDGGTSPVGIAFEMRRAFENKEILEVIRIHEYREQVKLSDNFWYQNTMLEHFDGSEDAKFKRLLLS